MVEWARAQQMGFKVAETKPSRVAVWMEQQLPRGSRVLDLGCGTGRNAIFFAQQGHRVHAIDLVDAGVRRSAPPGLRSRVKFTKGSVVNRRFRRGHWHAALMGRLIQYLPPEQVQVLLRNVGGCLQSGGIVGISYNAMPSPQLREVYKLSTYSHELDSVRGWLSNHGFDVLRCEAGPKQPTGVPYVASGKTYDILARKR